MRIYNTAVRRKAMHLTTEFGPDSDHLLREKIREQVLDKVRATVESELGDGVLNDLSHEELVLLSQRLEEPNATEFELVRVLVDALVPRPTGEGIRLNDRGVNVPEDNTQH
jgi:hypothetical protein